MNINFYALWTIKIDKLPSVTVFFVHVHLERPTQCLLEFVNVNIIFLLISFQNARSQ